MPNKVILFGATGEIGSRVANGCVKVGHQVTGVSRGSNSRYSVDLDGVAMIHGDQYDEAFIKNLVTAFVSAVGKGKHVHGEVFIFSCLKAITLQAYLETAMEFLGSKSEIQPLPTEELLKKDDIGEKGLLFLLEHMSFTVEKAQALLDYRPKFTVQEGLTQGLQWCRDAKLL